MIRTLTLEAPRAFELDAPTVAPTCEACGAIAAPDGACLEVGTCSRADADATRHMRGATAKYSVPAAWNARGSVD